MRTESKRARWWSRRRGDHAEQRVLSVEEGNFPPDLIRPTAAGRTVTERSAMAVADVFACVRLLANTAASLPLVCYRRVGEGRERYDGTTPELLRRPSPAVTQPNLTGTLVAHLAFWGNAFLGKLRDPTNR